jgi:hypothetical protein
VTGAKGTGTSTTEPKDAPHEWVLAANVPVTDRQMRYALLRGSLPLASRTKIEAIEGFCKNCRRPYEDVADEPCVYALGQNEHLRGGPIGERKKRTKTHGPTAATA